MGPKSSLLALIMLLICVVLSGCGTLDPLPANADQPLRVTPFDTFAGNMIATIRIDEDQDAADQLSVVTLQMSFDAIEEDNYVHFYHGEYVVCNGDKETMGDTPQYTFKIGTGGYNCSYVGYKPGTGLLVNNPVTVFLIKGRSRLHPQALSFSSQGYTIRYTPDPGSIACPITAVASDSSGNTVNGSSSSSANGLYDGPNTSSLTGTGEIVLKRTCSWTFVNPPREGSDGHALYKVYLTYQSTASVEVTWSH